MMKTGYRGTFVISWVQTEVDGFDAAPLQSLTVGATWRWHGDATRVDGPSDILQLAQAEGADELRARAARSVRRLVGRELEKDLSATRPLDAEDIPMGDKSFLVTDGAQAYVVMIIEMAGTRPSLLIFVDKMPPRNRDLWIVRHTLEDQIPEEQRLRDGGIICFTPGTRIMTPEGIRLIDDLHEGDLVETKDNGAQPIEWIGSRRMSGARLFTMPKLRPIRINAHFFGDDRPDEDLIVSPEHRILIQGDVARDLFNTPEVLVAAKDLINEDTVTIDMSMREVTYVHLLFDRHQVLWANGVQTESYHPASVGLGSLVEGDRMRLLARHPQLSLDPMSYGGFARRSLTTSEAAILSHAA